MKKVESNCLKNMEVEYIEKYETPVSDQFDENLPRGLAEEIAVTPEIVLAPVVIPKKEKVRAVRKIAAKKKPSIFVLYNQIQNTLNEISLISGEDMVLHKVKTVRENLCDLMQSSVCLNDFIDRDRKGNVVINFLDSTKNEIDGPREAIDDLVEKILHQNLSMESRKKALKGYFELFFKKLDCTKKENRKNMVNFGLIKETHEIFKGLTFKTEWVSVEIFVNTFYNEFLVV
jgi:hypothetical protein